MKPDSKLVRLYRELLSMRWQDRPRADLTAMWARIHDATVRTK